MVETVASGNSGSSSGSSGARGVELLQLPRPVRITQRYDENAESKGIDAGEQIELAEGLLSVQLITVGVQEAYGQSASSSGKDDDTDIFLVLSVPTADFSLPLMATQRIEHRPAQNAYVIDSPEVPGASVIIYVPAASTPDQEATRAALDDILASYCVFNSDASSARDRGHIELVSAEDGRTVIGTVDLDADGISLKEADGFYTPLGSPAAEKEPVLIDLDFGDETKGAGAGRVSTVRPISALDTTADKQAAAAAEPNDWLLRGANRISKGIISGSSFLSAKMMQGAESYADRRATKSGTATPSEKADGTAGQQQSEATIPAAVLQTAATVNALGVRAVGVSHKTAASIQNVAGRVGDRVGRATGLQSKPKAGTQEPPKGVRGVLNRSLVAASTVWDSVDTSAQQLLESGSSAATSVIRTKYGDQAAVLSAHVGGTTRNAFLVYRDVSGVRRRALLKVAGKSVIKARTPDGRVVDVQIGEVSPAATPGAAQGVASGSALSEKK